MPARSGPVPLGTRFAILSARAAARHDRGNFRKCGTRPETLRFYLGGRLNTVRITTTANR